MKISKDVSSFFKLNVAVPQGSWLGPLCFIVYMNNMPFHINTRTRIYIDDTTIFESVSSANNSVMSSPVGKSELYSVTYNKNLNVKKTNKIMIISFINHRDPMHSLLLYKKSRKSVERLHLFRILGVILSEDFSWKQHVNDLHTQ